jgi:hypothetical protein
MPRRHDENGASFVLALTDRMHMTGRHLAPTHEHACDRLNQGIERQCLPGAGTVNYLHWSLALLLRKPGRVLSLQWPVLTSMIMPVDRLLRLSK